MLTSQKHSPIHRRALPRLAGALVAALCALGPSAAAQSTLAENTPVVVTEAGLFVVFGGQVATQVLTPAAFGGGTIEAPSVTWIDDTDTFFVTRRNTTGAGGLWRVQLTPGGTASVEDLTPSLPPGFGRDFRDADYSVGLDVLFVLESSTGQVLALSAPVTAPGGNLAAWSQLGQHVGVALSVRGAKQPFSVLVVTAEGSVLASRPSGLTNVNTKHDPAWKQITTNRVTGGYILSDHANDEVVVATDDVPSDLPTAYPSLNHWQFCAPVANMPLDIEWDGRRNRAVALAGDILANCVFGAGTASGPNHLLLLPSAVEGPPGAGPKLLTAAADSGIAGANGDLALVRHDLPDITWFGSGGTGTGTSAPLFGKLTYALRIGFTSKVDVTEAPPSAPAFLVLGMLPLNAPFKGQVLGPLPQLIVPTATNAAGECVLPTPIPSLQALVGLHLYLQWWISDTTTPAPGDFVSSQLGIFTIGT